MKIRDIVPMLMFSSYATAIQTIYVGKVQRSCEADHDSIAEDKWNMWFSDSDVCSAGLVISPEHFGDNLCQGQSMTLLGHSLITFTGCQSSIPGGSIKSIQHDSEHESKFRQNVDWKEKKLSKRFVLDSKTEPQKMTGDAQFNSKQSSKSQINSCQPQSSQQSPLKGQDEETHESASASMIVYPSGISDDGAPALKCKIVEKPDVKRCPSSCGGRRQDLITPVMYCS